MLYKEVFEDESIEMRYKTQQCSFEVVSNKVKVSSFPLNCLLCGVTQCAHSRVFTLCTLFLVWILPIGT